MGSNWMRAVQRLQNHWRWGRFGLLALASWLVVGTVAACSTPQNGVNTPQGNATAGATQTITVYSGAEAGHVDDYLAAFQAQHPEIAVNLVRQSAAAITDQLLAEADNPQADVVWGTPASSVLLAEARGLLEPYAPAGLETVNPQLRDEANPPKWVGTEVVMSAFCVNAGQAKRLGLPIPQGWADLTDPVYKGHIVMSNPYSSTTGFLSLSTVLQNSPTEAEGWAYLDQLHENVDRYMRAGSPPCEMVSAGKFPIGISYDYRAVTQKNQFGRPVQVVFPVEGSGWDLKVNALVKKPEIKAAAKTFLDWAISPEAMEIYAKYSGVTAVKTDVPLLEGFPADPIAQLADHDLRWGAANRDRVIAEWQKRYDDKSTQAEANR